MPLPEAALAAFQPQRPRLLRLAYRMLGSRAAADDIVQEAWVRWSRSDTAGVDTPGAFLARIVTRLCLDEMKSARARREEYYGAWLPEPLAELSEEPVAQDDLTVTLMLALERLSPLERAAFLLHDVFEVPLGEVAETLGREAAAVRQLASRARNHVRASRPRFPVDRADGERIALAFHEATRTGDLATLQSLLAADVMIQSDGGGKVLAFFNVIRGIDKVLRLYRGLLRKFGPDEHWLRPVRIDGLPGYVSRAGGHLQSTALEIEDGRITAIYIVRNPDKLTRLAQELDIPFV